MNKQPDNQEQAEEQTAQQQAAQPGTAEVGIAKQFFNTPGIPNNWYYAIKEGDKHGKVLIAALEAVEAREAKLTSLVKKLLKCTPLDDDGYCVFCGNNMDYTNHDPSCPWITLRDYVQ